jgi:hypothetical protein
MKTAVAAAAILLSAASMTWAQDDRDRKMDELRREFERTLETMKHKYEAERFKMEQMFKAEMERLKKGAPREDERRPEEKKPRGTDELLQRILERLDHLEKRFDQELPRFDFKKMPFENLPKFEFKRFDRDFDFKDFKEFAPHWRELLPKFKDEEFRFEFKKKDDDDRKDEKKDKKDKKEKKDDEKKKY